MAGLIRRLPPAAATDRHCKVQAHWRIPILYYMDNIMLFYLSYFPIQLYAVWKNLFNKIALYFHSWKLGLDLPWFAVFPAMAIRSPGPARTSPLLLNCQSAEDNQAGIKYLGIHFFIQQMLLQETNTATTLRNTGLSRTRLLTPLSPEQNSFTKKIFN